MAVGRVYRDVDSGWAWVLAAGVALWNALIAGTLKSFGVLYLEFLDLYEQSPVITGWIGSSLALFVTIYAPLSGYISDQLSLRAMRILIMTTGVVLSAGVVATGWAPTAPIAMVTYGFIVGTCCSVVDSPILSFLTTFFRSRRFLANGVGFAGSSVGTLVLPPLLTCLIQHYGLSGAMLVFGGLWLNTCVIGAALLPLLVVSDSELTRRINNVDQKQKEKEEVSMLSMGTVVIERDGKFDRNGDVHSEELFMQVRSENGIANKRNTKSDTENTADKQICQPLYDSSKHSTSNGDQLNNLQEKHDPSSKEHHPVSGEVGGTKAHSFCAMAEDYWTFISTPGLPPLMLMFIFASFAYYNQFFLFPPFAHEHGHGKMLGSVLVSLPNISELVSRLVLGLLIDKGYVNRIYLLYASFLISCFLGVGVSFFGHSWVVLVCYSATFGLYGGVFVPMLIPLLAELVPEHRIGSVSGLFPFLTGIGIFAGPPLLAGVKELTGLYSYALLTTCSCYLLAALCLLLSRWHTPCLRPRPQPTLYSAEI